MGSTPIAGTIFFIGNIAQEEDNMNQLAFQIIILIVFIAAMYFLLIRPQKKKEKQITDMRNSIVVGDKIVTIGGICGKVVKTKEETIVIMVGADKVKFEIKRWAVSSIEEKNEKETAAAAAEKEEPKKVTPKKLKKKAEKEEPETETKEEKKEAPAEEPKEEPKDVPEENPADEEEVTM